MLLCPEVHDKREVISMRIEEIVDLQSLVNKSQTDALNNQAKQLKVKKAKLAADKARQQATKAQQRVQKVQTKP